jgi:alkylation response protein AidB-like acyl-CoA dehydrogenase
MSEPVHTDAFEPINLTEEQGLVRETARGFARSELTPLAPEIDEKERMPRTVWNRLGALQLLGVPIPEEYGGMGLNALCAATVIEELAAACASTALSVAAHVGLGTLPIAKHGSAEQKKKYLPDLCVGKKLAAFGLTEPGAGSDAAALQTRAEKKGDRYILNGNKMFITNAHVADVYVVAVATKPGAGPKGITALIVEKNSKGLTVSKCGKKLGMRGSDWGELAFQNVEVPETNRMGKENEGFGIFMDTLVGGRVGIAALGVGLGQGAFEAAAGYAQERHQFGHAIGSFQSVGNMIADMSSLLDAGRLLTYRAAQLRDAGKPHKRQASVAKLFTSEACNKICTDAIQVLGGYGYTKAPARSSA